MDHGERSIYLIEKLLQESREYEHVKVPEQEGERNYLLRSLMNLRPPHPISQDFLQVQDIYLKEELQKKGVTELAHLTPTRDQLFIWQGDITTLKVDAIVNAANAQLLGCFAPGHNCIDNIIHTYSGIQLRLACSQLIAAQGHPEPTGTAKITSAYNLPCRYVLHTVGPIISGKVQEEDRRLLASCYRSCLELAAQHQVSSLAFCCISTGEFHFPNQLAAEIAVETVTQFLTETHSPISVIFNVFKDIDLALYQNLLH